MDARIRQAETRLDAAEPAPSTVATLHFARLDSGLVGVMHTPAPWTLSQDDHGQMCVDADEVLIARCTATWDGSYGNRFDALLIKAAPQLLAACKRAFEAFGNSSSTDHEKAMALVALEQARIEAETPPGK